MALGELISPLAAQGTTWIHRGSNSWESVDYRLPNAEDMKRAEVEKLDIGQFLQILKITRQVSDEQLPIQLRFLPTGELNNIQGFFVAYEGDGIRIFLWHDTEEDAERFVAALRPCLVGVKSQP